MTDLKKSLEENISEIFRGGATGTGEEELLRVASKYSMQLSSAQIKCLLYIQYRADLARQKGQENVAKQLDAFTEKWLQWKEYNNSAPFIMRIIDNISLRRYLTEQSFKVDIKK